MLIALKLAACLVALPAYYCIMALLWDSCKAKNAAHGKLMQHFLSTLPPPAPTKQEEKPAP